MPACSVADKLWAAAFANFLLDDTAVHGRRCCLLRQGRTGGCPCRPGSSWLLLSQGGPGTGKPTHHPDFPKPRAELATGPVWAWPDVEEWAKATGRVNAHSPTRHTPEA